MFITWNVKEKIVASHSEISGFMLRHNISCHSVESFARKVAFLNYFRPASRNLTLTLVLGPWSLRTFFHLCLISLVYICHLHNIFAKTFI